MTVKQYGNILSSTDDDNKEESKQMLKWYRKSENVTKWSVHEVRAGTRNTAVLHKKEAICRAQRNETCKKKKNFRAGRKTNFPTTPFSRPANVEVFGKSKKK